MCTVCGKPMVFRGHDDVWVCDTCHRCVCWRCKTSVLPEIDAEVPRVTVQCDACRKAEEVMGCDVAREWQAASAAERSGE